MFVASGAGGVVCNPGPMELKQEAGVEPAVKSEPPADGDAQGIVEQLWAHFETAPLQNNDDMTMNDPKTIYCNHIAPLD